MTWNLLVLKNSRLFHFVHFLFFVSLYEILILTLSLDKEYPSVVDYNLVLAFE